MICYVAQSDAAAELAFQGSPQLSSIAGRGPTANRGGLSIEDTYAEGARNRQR